LNGVIFSDLGMTLKLTQISGARHYSALNISEIAYTALYVITKDYKAR